MKRLPTRTEKPANKPVLSKAKEKVLRTVAEKVGRFYRRWAEAAEQDAKGSRTSPEAQ
ncbi:MAG: hypothetical protein ACYTEL_14915 [Planctomycetota bacterium]